MSSGVVRQKMPQVPMEGQSCAFCLEKLSVKRFPSRVQFIHVQFNGEESWEEFERFCTQLNVNLTTEKEKVTLDGDNKLPLCYTCQDAFHCMVQLKVQVKQLEVIIGNYEDLLRTKIEKAKETKKIVSSEGPPDVVKPYPSPVSTEESGQTKKEMEALITTAIKIETEPVLEETRANVNDDVVQGMFSSNGSTPPGSPGSESLSEGNYFVRDEDDSDSNIGPPDSVSEQEGDHLGDPEDSDPDSSRDSDYSPEEEADSDAEVNLPKRRSTRSSNSVARNPQQDRPHPSWDRSNREFTCHLCDEQLTGLTAFAKHYAAVHPDEKRYTCKYCQRHFKEYRDIIRHQRRHTGELPLTCEICEKKFRDTTSLKAHHTNKHSGRERVEVLLPCSKCDKVFSSKRKLGNHMSATHDEVPDEIYCRSGRPRKSFTCHICDKELIGMGPFHQHYAEVHPEEVRYTCKFCQRIFKEYRDVIRHQRRHTGERPFPCDECEKAFHDDQSLKLHREYIHQGRERGEVSFPCTECDKEFGARSQLRNHLIANHNLLPNQYNCRSGNPKKSYTCHICDKALVGMGPFNQHYSEEHPDEKRYTCKFCQRHFKNLRDCIRHQRNHTGERPFQCDECSKAFTDMKGLKSHKLNSHSKNNLTHVCTTCGKKYVTKSALTAHMNVHSEALRFCTICGRGFRNPSSFCKHNKKAHGGAAKQTDPITDLHPDSLERFGVSYHPKGRKCHICWEPILSRTFIATHFAEKHPEHTAGSLTCRCGKRFSAYKDVQKHATRHDSKFKAFQCDQCPLAFYTNTELKVHAARHAPLEERKSNVCDICGLGLVSPAALAHHKKKHEGNQMRWVCEMCGRDYAEKKGLVYHMKSEHLNILPYKCTLEGCGKAFAGRSDWTKHMRKHSGLKPYKCSYCEKCFPYTSTRARHEKEVHEEGGGVEGRKRRQRESRNKAKPEDVTMHTEMAPVDEQLLLKIEEQKSAST